MDNRIQEVEQMIVDCNAHMLAKKQLSLISAEDWKTLLETISNIQKATIVEQPEVKRKATPTLMPQEESESTKEIIPQDQPREVSELVCSKCGETLKAGAKFCKFCGTVVDTSMAVSQPPPVNLCTCGAKISTGAKFCRNCGKPVL